MNTKHLPVKAVLVDLDGVLRIWSDDTYLIEDSHRLPRGAIENFAFAAPHLMPAIRGMSLDAEWRKLIAQELLRTYPKSDAYEAVQHWSKSIGQLDPQAIQAISNFDAGVKLVLATNGTSCLRADLAILDLFSGIANSSELGAVKPE